MKENAPGNPSCSRISHDSTSATNPIAMAVIEYWMAITLASWEKTYFVTQLVGMVEIYFGDFGRRHSLAGANAIRPSDDPAALPFVSA